MRKKNCILVLMTLAFMAAFNGLAAADPDGSRGWDCSRCHSDEQDVTVRVPSLVGLSQAAAGTAITNARLRVGSITTQTSSTVPSGSVISQSPAANTNAVRNSMVNLVVSSGTPAPVNKPPVAEAGPVQTVVEGSSVTLNGSNSSDPDDGIASYAWKQTTGTSVVLSNPAAATSMFTAPQAGGSSLTFQLTVRDRAGLTATDTCIVNVTPADNPPDNTAPVANAGPNQTATSGATVVLSGVNSTDPDGETLSYLWKQTAGPSVNLSGATLMEATFTAPAGGSRGTSLTFQLTVTDAQGLIAVDTCIVNINPDSGPSTNLPPVADAGPDQSVRRGERVRLNASNSSDPDGSIASYRWRQLEGRPVSLSNSRSATPTFRAPEARRSGLSLTFQVTVKDRGGLASSDTVIVQVSGRSGSDGSNDDDDDDDDDD